MSTCVYTCVARGGFLGESLLAPSRYVSTIGEGSTCLCCAVAEMYPRGPYVVWTFPWTETDKRRKALFHTAKVFVEEKRTFPPHHVCCSLLSGSPFASFRTSSQEMFYSREASVSSQISVFLVSCLEDRPFCGRGEVLCGISRQSVSFCRGRSRGSRCASSSSE